MRAIAETEGRKFATTTDDYGTAIATDGYGSARANGQNLAELLSEYLAVYSESPEDREDAAEWFRKLSGEIADEAAGEAAWLAEN